MRRILLVLLMLLGFGSLAIGQTQILMPLASQTGTFGSSVRGYWFQSPDCFTITGLDVPTTANTGTRNIAIVRFPAAPPFYSTTTNTFQVLALYQNFSATGGIIPVNIQVNQGDFIGVLGNRGDVNSYSTAPQTSTINGNTVTLNRLGMQFPLSSTAPQQLWQESGGSISRVFLYYDSTLVHNLSHTLVGNTANFTLSSDTTYPHVWDYGDGSPLDTVYNPSHTYAPGNYIACAYLYTACGIDTVCDTINLCTPPSTAYGVSTSAFTASFSDSTTGAVSYLWDFGDGNTSTAMSPTHTYSAIGYYNVCLTTTSSCGAIDSVCTTVLACVPPSAAWTSTNTTPDTVYFTNGSTDNWSQVWDFGDGNTDTSANPVHVYSSPGTYTICLTVSNPCGTDTSCQVVNLCAGTPVALYTDSIADYQAFFSDVSTGGGTSWLWDFGDGNTSNLQNPLHTYAFNGTYYVCLTTSNVCGDASTYCDSITICAPPAISFSWINNLNTVTFSNTTNAATSYFWVFGDGQSSTQTNPVHTYNQTGTFIACLTATNSCGSETFCDTLDIIQLTTLPGLQGAQVTISPNPADQFVNIQVDGIGANHEVDIELYDLNGRMLDRGTGASNGIIRMDVSGQPAGIYLYQIKVDGNLMQTGKLVVQ